MSKAEELAEWLEFDDKRCLSNSKHLLGAAAELRRLAQVERELEALKKAAKEVLSHVEGDLPTRGWLRDNDLSRAAIGALKHTIKEVK